MRLLRSREDVAFGGDEIVPGAPIEAEAALRPRPGIFGTAAAEVPGRAEMVAVDIGAVGELVADAAAILRRAAPLAIARAGLEEGPLGLGRVPRDDVDDAVDRVGAVERAARPADHLDAI